MRKILTILLLLLALSVQAQTAKQLKVYQKGGVVDTLRLLPGAAISHSKTDAAGHVYGDYAVMTVVTAPSTQAPAATLGQEGVRQYFIADLDSLVFPNGKTVVFRGSTLSKPNLAPLSVVGGGSAFHSSFSGNFPLGKTVTFYWTENDHIRLDVGAESRAKNLTANNTNADFFFEDADLEAPDYLVYFPDKNVKILSHQTQTGANNSDHIGTSGDCGTAIATRGSDGTYSFELTHAASYFCFLPHIDHLPSAKLTKITVSCNYDIAGDYQVSQTGPNQGDNTSQTITLDLVPQAESDFFIGHDVNAEQDSCAAYMVLAPQTTSRNFTVAYYVTDTLSRIEKVFYQRFSLKPEINTLYPIVYSISDAEFRSIDLGLSANWSSYNAGAGEPSQAGPAYPDAAAANAALLAETVVTEWVIPSDAQCRELLTKCQWTRGTYNGKTGYFVEGAAVSVEQGKRLRIFIPCAEGVTPEQCLAASYRPVETLMVDLGLESGTQWAVRNIGAYAPEGYGDYYAWGETETKETYSQDNYSFYQNSTYLPLGTDFDISGTAHDVARVLWGSMWSMPTKAQWEELAACKWNSLTLNGIAGFQVVGPNGNSIFLPAAGSVKNATLTNDATQSNKVAHYWVSVQPSESSTLYAWTMTCGSGWDSQKPILRCNSDRQDSYRYYGTTVRAVANPNAAAGAIMNVFTDEAEWTLGSSRATLWGDLTSLTPVDGTLEVGFFVGDNESVGSSDYRYDFPITRTALGRFSQDINLNGNYGYWYCAYVKIGEDYYCGQARHVGWEMVDLGLSVKWANMNVSASAPHQAGAYYAWGETSPKVTYTQSSYNFYGKKPFESSNNYYPLGNNYDIAGTSYDAARANMEGAWRMPSKDEMTELSKCPWTMTTFNDVLGFKVTGPNDKSIFLPTVGSIKDATLTNGSTASNKVAHYWTSTQKESKNEAYAWTITCSTSWDNSKPFLRANTDRQDSYRYYGTTVRAVADPNIVVGDVLMDIRTDDADWQTNAATATMRGHVSSVHPVSGSVTVGFVVGDSINIVRGKVPEGNDYSWTVSSLGDFSKTVDVYNNMGSWYRAYVVVDGQTYYGDAKHFGLEMVDLGLPSGLLWANMNVGADAPSQYGDYYAWGETTTKDNYTSATYEYYKNAWLELGIDISYTGNDAATANMGQLWRTPFQTECKELIDNCDWTEVMLNDVYCWKVTSRKNPNRFIYFPKAKRPSGTTYESGNVNDGCYMTATRYNNEKLCDFYLPGGGTPACTPPSNINEKRKGYSVRAVAVVQAVRGTGYATVCTGSAVKDGETPAVTLHGTLLGTEPQSGEEVGFLVGDVEPLAVGQEGTTYYPLTDVSSGEFTQVVDMTDKQGIWYRAVLKDGADYRLGPLQSYGLVKVDLGLPSGLRWANMNVGADAPEDGGGYYTWGGLEPHADGNYSQNTYEYYVNSKYQDIGSDISGTNYDVARRQWGGTWRIPTQPECNEISKDANATWMRAEVNGQPCMIAQRKDVYDYNDHRYILFPRAGRINGTNRENVGDGLYISATQYSSSDFNDFYIQPTGPQAETSNHNSKWKGMTVRPVSE